MDKLSQNDALVSGYFDGTLAPDAIAELEAKLMTDDQFAEYLSRWCFMHRQFVDLLTEDMLHEMMEQFVSSSPGLSRNAFIHASKRSGGMKQNRESVPHPRTERIGRRDSPRFSRLAMGALAVTAAAFFTLSVVLWRANRAIVDTQTAADPQAATRPTGPPTGDAVATLTQIVDAVWAPDARMFRHGQQLRRGSRIALSRGLAKVTFECGAEIVLEGPCDFVIQTQMVGFLKSGRITANVPRRAFAFAILSPGIDFVDLGTSFGLDVGATGRAELHVFEGEVLCSRANGENEERNPIFHVKANQAVEFQSQGGRPSDIAINRQQFSELISWRRGAYVEGRPLLPENLALWLSADSGVTTDNLGRVVSWHDIIFGDNEAAEDAVQVDERARPLLITKSVNGRAAVRFDGTSDFLLTTPLETTDDQTVFIVCQFSESALATSRRWGGQILNYDGPPSRYLSDTLEPGVLQIGEPLLEEEFQSTLLTGQVFAGFIGSTTVEAGRIDAKPVGANSPVIIAYQYDYTGGRAALAVNGKEYGDARAFAPQGITSRKIIGRHAWMQNFFHGDLAELLIFNKALSPDELTRTTAYLADKYAIMLEASGSAADAK
jgi:Concanavalin A-like lectin/glucanases superfamily